MSRKYIMKNGTAVEVSEETSPTASSRENSRARTLWRWSDFY